MRVFFKIIFVFPFLWSSCNFAPKYQRDETSLPATYRSESEVDDAFAHISWWKELGDEVLNELIELSLENNKDLQVAVWRVLQYKAEYEVVRSSLFPQFTLNSLAVKEKLPIDENFLPSGFSPLTPDFRLNMAVSYELDFWGKLRNATSAAHLEYLAQIENRRNVVLTLIGSVVESYILLRQLDLQLDLAEAVLESRKESLQIALYRFEGGLTSRIEVDQASSVYQEAVATVEDLKKKVPQQENLLSILLGQNPGNIRRGKSLSELILPRQIPIGKPLDLLTRRPDIIQAENMLRAANANIGVARAAFFPDITFAALYGFDNLQLSQLFNNSSKTWSIGGTLLQQVFTGGKLIGRLRSAKAQKMEMLFTYEQKILTALKEVNDALVGLNQSQKIFAADKAQVDALKDYLSLAWDRYYEGQTQYLTVLDAQRHVLNAELNAASAEADQFFAFVSLYKSLGGPWVFEADSQVKAQNK